MASHGKKFPDFNLMKAFRLVEPKRTLSGPKNGEGFVFLKFINFAILGALLLAASAVLNFYFSLRGKNKRTSKILGNISPTLRRDENFLCFCFKKIVATN